MPSRVILVNSMSFILLLSLSAGCPQAGEWPAKGTGAFGATGLASCMPAECEDEGQACADDPGCSQLRSCVECEGKQCATDCACKHNIAPASIGYFNVYIACIITNCADCTSETVACGASPACSSLFQCVDACDQTPCDSSCVESCKNKYPDGVIEFTAWGECANSALGR